MFEQWDRIIDTILGITGFTAIMSVNELRHTIVRLRKVINRYIDAVEFGWTNQTEEFALDHRVRAYEVMLRNVQAIQPRTPLAYRRVEQVRDAVEFFHRNIGVYQDKHRPLPKLDEFPYRSLTPEMEVPVRRKILEELRAIKWCGFKWLGLKGPAEK